MCVCVLCSRGTLVGSDIQLVSSPWVALSIFTIDVKCCSISLFRLQCENNSRVFTVKIPTPHGRLKTVKHVKDNI